MAKHLRCILSELPYGLKSKFLNKEDSGFATTKKVNLL